MSASSEDRPDPRDTLARIADALGEPVERFYAPPSEWPASDTHELLQLWLSLETPEQRRRALAIVRRLAAH